MPTPPPKMSNPLDTMSKPAMRKTLESALHDLVAYENRCGELMHLITVMMRRFSRNGLLGPDGQPMKIQVELHEDDFNAVAGQRWRLEKRAEKGADGKMVLVLNLERHEADEAPPDVARGTLLVPR